MRVCFRQHPKTLHLTAATEQAVSPPDGSEMLWPADDHFGHLRSLGDTGDHGKSQAAYDFLFTLSSK